MESNPIAVLRCVRERFGELVTQRVSDALALQLSICCGSVDAEALIEFAAEGVLRREVIAHRRELAMTPREFSAFFNSKECLMPQHQPTIAAAEQLLRDEHGGVKRLVRIIESAMRTTLQESLPKERWQRCVGVRLASILAFVRENDDSHEAINVVHGGLVAVDARRIEDTKAEFADVGLDVLMTLGVVKAAVALVLGGDSA
jgi:hypothetical protein